MIDDHLEAVPAAFFITSSLKADDYAACLKELQQKLREQRSDWRPSCFILDDADAESKAVRCGAVRPCSR